MNDSHFEEFLKQLHNQDIVSEFYQFGMNEKIVPNISIIEENKICLN
jgi:hypothetical protein